MTAALMFQGTGSDVGKSLLVAGLCRALHRRGLRVRPFKPQNMSNNAAVADGGEIGRAQALQARACAVAAHVDMNPVLLKPQGERQSQLVVNGRVRGSFSARDYHRHKPALLEEALAAYRRLAASADIVLVEGAGSPAEINLRGRDIANMGFAAAANLPVVLIGDIDRGGVIAQIVGTGAVLAEEDRARICGFIVNKFRGDPALFETGMRMIEEHSGWPGLGLVPWFADAARLPAEDSMALSAGGNPSPPAPAHRRVKICIPRLPHIANFDDFDPLRAEADVELIFLPPGEALPGDADLVVLPGSKATLADLAFLRAQGWDVDIRAHWRRGGHVLGICAGLQMLGRRIADPDGIEGTSGAAEGLGLLPVDTVLTGEKVLREARLRCVRSGHVLHGYEMHVGRSQAREAEAPFRDENGAPAGVVSADGRIMGCYLHGLFAADDWRRDFLRRLNGGFQATGAYEEGIERVLDDLADHLIRHIDMKRLLAVAGLAR